MTTAATKLTGNRALAAIAALATLALLGGCATNPVTGKRELILVPPNQAVEMGVQQYAPMQQAQGGEYDLDPELNAYVQQVGQRLAAVSERQLPYEFTVLNNSVPNAWALPGGKIAINRGLLTELESEAELAAVLGHEVVHAAAGHSRQAMQRGLLVQGALLAGAVAAHDSDYGSIALGGASIAAQALNQRYSRGAELEADEYGMRYMSRAGYDPQGAVDLQRTFVRLSENERPGWLAGLFASHPPSQDRVEANEATAASLPSGGERGAEQYQAAIGRTLEARPAYERYDEGRKALSEGNAALAMTRADEAIELEPGEANFYALRGDARLLEKDYSGAIGHYGEAIARNDDFFYYYLQRGLARERLREDAGASADLERSIELLPTGPAYYALGNIAKRQRRYAEAREHYAAASGASGEVGRAAQAELMRLDLPSQPEQYLRKQTGLDADGQLLVSVANPTGVAVRDLRLVIQYVGADGRAREVTRAVRGTLPGGRSIRVATGLGPFTSPGQYRVAIASARVAE